MNEAQRKMTVGQEPLALTGFVTHLGKVGESHLLVEVFSAREGRVTLMARGARASRRRFRGVFELLNLISIQSRVVSGTGLWPVEAADIERVYGGALKTSYPAIARAMGIVGVVRSLFPEREAAPDAFAVLARALGYLDENLCARAAGAYVHLAQLSGILPDISRCLFCRRVTSTLALAPEAAGLACRTCHPRGAPLPKTVLRALGAGRTESSADGDAVEQLIAALASRHGARPVLLLPRV